MQNILRIIKMSSPPAVLYFIQSEPTKEHYMAMAQTYFLIGNVMMTIVRAYNGFLTTTVLTDYCFGLGGVIIGTSLGATPCSIEIDDNRRDAWICFLQR